jgi:branched-subunit amino acid transport protein AzlD
MFVKTLVIITLFIILICLGSALYFLVKDDSKSNRLVKALTWRIGISIFLFVMLFIGFATGFISPHPVGG